MTVCSDANLILVEAPVLEPGEFTIDAEQVQSMNQELADAAEMELPVGEDDEF